MVDHLVEYLRTRKIYVQTKQILCSACSPGVLTSSPLAELRRQRSDRRERLYSLSTLSLMLLTPQSFLFACALFSAAAFYSAISTRRCCSPLLMGFCLSCHLSWSRTILSRATHLSPITIALLPRYAASSAQAVPPGGGAAAVCLAMGLFPCNRVKGSPTLLANQLPLIPPTMPHSSSETTIDRHGLSSAGFLPDWLDMCSSDRGYSCRRNAQ